MAGGASGVTSGGMETSLAGLPTRVAMACSKQRAAGDALGELGLGGVELSLGARYVEARYDLALEAPLGQFEGLAIGAIVSRSSSMRMSAPRSSR